MSATIYITVSGIGLGHAGRSFKIAEKLANKGYRIAFSAYGEAVRYISRKFKCFSISPVRLSWRGAGGLSLRATSKFILKSGLPTFMRQVIEESKIISQINPSLVLSDSRGSSLIAGKILSKPTLTITNQLAVYIPEQETGKYLIKLANKLSPEILPRLWLLSDKLALIDLPPPYTISERNLKVKMKSDKVFFVGLIGEKVNKDEEFERFVKSLFENSRRPLIYVSATGPREERSVFIEIMRRLLPELDDYNFIFTLGNLDGSTEPRVSRNIVEFDWLEEREKIIGLADLIISRAGRTTIDQCVMNLKPMIVIPSFRQTEQEENARRVEELGIGKNLRQRDVNVAVLKEAVQEILENRSLYIKKLDSLSKLSRSLGGVGKVIELALSLLS